MGEYIHCGRCNGTGVTHDCVDDLCAGGRCIHGDNYTCPNCGGDGDVYIPDAFDLDDFDDEYSNPERRNDNAQ